MKFWRLWLIPMLLLAAQAAWTQEATLTLSGGAHDNSQPVEVTADSLTVDQASSAAVFEGNAKVTQGALQLSAGIIRVDYRPEDGEISQVTAEGGVIFTNGTESAEAESAAYRIGESEITLSGSVLLLQGRNTIAGDQLVLDLVAGTGTMRGNVKTVFSPNGQQ